MEMMSKMSKKRARAVSPDKVEPTSATNSEGQFTSKNLQFRVLRNVILETDEKVIVKPVKKKQRKAAGTNNFTAVNSKLDKGQFLSKKKLVSHSVKW